MTVAQAYYVEGETYTGFDPAAASAIEPNLSWAGNEPAEAGVVSINKAEGSLVILSTLDASGEPFCIADDASLITYGRTDALDAQESGDCSTNASPW